jgi:hypothetical protein
MTMTADWYPGAHHLDLGGTGWLTVDIPDNVLHIAASSWNINEADPTNLDGINGWIETGYTEAHGYNDQFGNQIQYCSVRASVGGTLNGNYRNRTWEAWNPPGSDGDLNLSGYTPEQCERFSDLLAWDHINNGTLLQDMNDSRPSSHGVGCHRYGITGYNPYRSVGGEVWSTSSSKVCPGTARIAQLPGIITRAKAIANAVQAGLCGYLPKGRVNLTAALARTVTTPTLPKGFLMALTDAEQAEVLAKVQTLTSAVTSLSKTVDKLAKQVAWLHLNETNGAVEGRPFTKTAANFNDTRAIAKDVSMLVAALPASARRP